jgi:serine phosphatase RsbU (regulator of sigma subunit)
LAAASQGTIAEFSGNNQSDRSQSILQANVTTALCAPLMLGTTVAAYLYLDSRGGTDQPARPPHPNSAGFCMALCRIGGLALANLKRIDIERRASRLEGELTAASEAQRWILPRKPVTAGPFVCAGHSQPGGFLGGDFFDALVLPDGRLAVALGDVSGHSAAASVLMTASQGFLHASLISHGKLARAFNDLNSFVQARSSAETFVTLWAGIFDPREMSLQYVDAGHGYAMLSRPDKTIQLLDENGGIPIGIDAGCSYDAATITLAPGDRVLVFSDGIAEQTNHDGSSEGQRQQFGKLRVQQLMLECEPESLLADLFSSLRTFAGGSNFADDVTGVLVHWSHAR